MSKKLDLKENLSFGFEQTFSIPNWWADEGFTSKSDTPLKREKMLALAIELSVELKGEYKETLDIWDHMQYEVSDHTGVTQFYVTMDPGSIEVKTPPCLIHEVEKMAAPLFIAAQRADVVPYRNWWYGIQGGTEGGCHVNMGGMSDETNPLLNEPELVVKYAAYAHNRPWLHYPFMSLDVGPEGNAMRMDEKKDFDKVIKAFESYDDIYQSGDTLTPQQTHDHFKDTNLINEKSSYPSLYKFKTGLFLIEDRGQEALRCAEDFFLVCDMRIKIFEYLRDQNAPEKLITFDNLHTQGLTSFWQWEQFQIWANELDLDASKYQRFFDRQFQTLTSGEGAPEHFSLKEGRRPRVITSVDMKDGVARSKTVDTSYKRIELSYSSNNEEKIKFTVKADGVELKSPLHSIKENHNFSKKKHAQYLYIDIKYDQENPLMEIQFEKNSVLIETAYFNFNDMMWEKK